MPPGGSLGDCAPLTTRFPPLTRKRAMTNEKYGPTLPTGRYTVADHALGSWLPVRPDGRYFYSTDSHQCTPGPKCKTGFPPVRRAISRSKYHRSAAGFPRPLVRLGASQSAVTGRRRPVRNPRRVTRDAAQVRGLRTVLSPGPPPGRPDDGPACAPARKAALRILFLSARQNCPQTDVSFPGRFGGQYWGVACNPIWDTMAKADGGWQCDAS